MRMGEGMACYLGMSPCENIFKLGKETTTVSDRVRGGRDLKTIQPRWLEIAIGSHQFDLKQTRSVFDRYNITSAEDLKQAVCPVLR